MSSNKNIYNYQTPKSSNEDTSFFNTKGRINRVAFFARLFLVILIYSISFFIFNSGIHKLFGFRIEIFFETIHLYLFPFVLLLFLLIQGDKRMHDVNKSGWCFFIPFYNLYLILSPGTKGNNDYGIDFNFKQDITYFDEIEQVENPKVIINKTNSLKKRFGAIKVVFILFLLIFFIMIFLFQSSLGKENDVPFTDTITYSVIESIGASNSKKNKSTTSNNQNSNNIDTVRIGFQIWACNNLDVDTFLNGDKIPEVKSDEKWALAAKNKQPAWCYFDNNSKNRNIHGKLYNWYAINDSRGIVSKGWHVPTENDWNEFVNYFGGFPINIKDIRMIKKWNVLCSGVRGDGIHQGLFMYGTGNHGGWWTSDEDSNDGAVIFDLNFRESTEEFYSASKGFGYSVRLIKDK
jgi:uncharacterized protein (TIGR02145 family)